MKIITFQRLSVLKLHTWLWSWWKQENLKKPCVLKASHNPKPQFASRRSSARNMRRRHVSPYESLIVDHCQIDSLNPAALSRDWRVVCDANSSSVRRTKWWRSFVSLSPRQLAATVGIFCFDAPFTFSYHSANISGYSFQQQKASKNVPASSGVLGIGPALVSIMKAKENKSC